VAVIMECVTRCVAIFSSKNHCAKRALRVLQVGKEVTKAPSRHRARQTRRRHPSTLYDGVQIIGCTRSERLEPDRLARVGTAPASRQMRSDRDDRLQTQFVLGRKQAVIDASNTGSSSTPPLGLPDHQATPSAVR